MHLLDTHWSYRNSVKTATGFSTFCLVYRTEAMSPAELIIPTERIIQGQELELDADMCVKVHMVYLEAIGEIREVAQERTRRYQQKMSNVYEKTICERVFIKRQLVLKDVDYVRRNVSTPSKFSPNWEGSYMIREAHGSGYYKLAKMDGIALCDLINGKWLKLYHA